MALLAFAGLAIGTYSAHHQVMVLFEKLRKIDSSIDHTGAALHFIQDHRGNLSEKRCQADLCAYGLHFTNRRISQFHVVPVAKIDVYMTFERNALKMIVVEYSSAIFKSDSPIVGVQEDFCPSDEGFPCNHFYLDPHGRNATNINFGSVGFGVKATPIQKQAGWALNADCFTAFRGCKNVSELLPTAWKLTAPGAISSRMRSMGDSIADSQQPLP